MRALDGTYWRVRWLAKSQLEFEGNFCECDMLAEKGRIIALARKRVEECSDASGHKLEEFALELEAEE